MARKTSTKLSIESSAALNDSYTLDLPVEPEFWSDPPLVSIQTMLDQIEIQRKSCSRGVPRIQECLADMLDVEFKL